MFSLSSNLFICIEEALKEYSERLMSIFDGEITGDIYGFYHLHIIFSIK